MELPLTAWLNALLAAANAAGEDDPDAHRLRQRLQQLIDGTLPLRHRFKRLLPPLYVSLRGNRLHVLSDLGPQTSQEVEDAQIEGWSVLERYGEALEGVIYAVSEDPLGARVRRCDQCRIFFLAKRNHNRKHHFCCEAHRRAFDHAHRDPLAQAEYQRQLRRSKAERQRARNAARH